MPDPVERARDGSMQVGSVGAGVCETRSTCPYCGVGCGVLIETRDGAITGVRGDPDHPANAGRLCTKGSTLHHTASAVIARQTRLLHPMRRAARGEAPHAVSWDAALDEAVRRHAQILTEHGPDAVGFYLSGQLLTEDYYVFNKLVKGVIGSNNVDTNSRLCMSSAVAGYKATLGADAPPTCYEDLALAGTLFIVGANPAHAHPILFRRIEDARRANPALRIVVADPRRTETAEAADLFLPILPGSDIALFHGMLHLMLWEGLVDTAYIAAHTRGFEALRDRVRDCPPKEAARLCGIPEDDLVRAARWFAGLDQPGTDGRRSPCLSLYCQGLNQSSSGTAKNAALINLHLATGQIGRPGAGPFSLTGQPNAMGGREVGGLANLLSAHRDMADPAHRAEVAALWGVADVPATPGKSALELFEAAADGQLKSLWIACTNPAQSLPDQALVRRALQRAEFVVVQEAFATTATCAHADLLLPATTWGEKDGTVTNSERRISRVRAALPAPGEARHDWAIAAEFGRRLQAHWPGARPASLAYADAEAVWNEHRESTRGRDLDITGLSYAALDHGPRQWPCPEGSTQGRARLYEDGRFATADGRARFFDTPVERLAEPRDARYPFSLNTGRLRDQWHGMSRTGTLGRLFGHAPEPVVELHPQDLARQRLAEGDLVRVSSRRGSVVLPVQASAQLAPAQAFIAMHWGEEVLSGHDGDGRPLLGVNALTTPARCPRSAQPELKHAAVRIAPAGLPWRLLAMAWLPEDEALSRREALRALMPAFDFASCVPFGRERSGLMFRAAAAQAPPDEWLNRLEALLGLAEVDVLRYADRQRGQRRSMRLAGDGSAQRLEAFLLGGDTRAEAWIRPLLQEGHPAHGYGRALLRPDGQAPRASPPRGRQVCSCLDVGEAAIRSCLAAHPGPDEAQLQQLHSRLGCGTQCGSCVPELKRLIRLQRHAA
jgi:assimilatory nitrate reductase catalytic subunit